MQLGYHAFMSDHGRIVIHRHKSEVLEGNPLGDRHLGRL